MTVLYNMFHIIENIKNTLSNDYFSAADMATVFPGSEDRRYALVKRAMAQDKIVSLRRGLYCLAAPYQRKPLDLFVIAQHIYGPSYISFESALSAHGWIPEAVMTTTSACIKRAQTFDNPLGRFAYFKLPTKNFYCETRMIQFPAGFCFMARPWKAVLDYVSVFKKDWKGVAPLIESLRIDEEELPSLKDYDVQVLEEYYQQQRVLRFLKGVTKDLNL